MKTRTLLVCATLALASLLGGCQTAQVLSNAVATTTSFGVAASNATVNQRDVAIAASAFDAAEITAANYLSLPRCKTGGPVLCRAPKATKPTIAAIRAGRAARDNLEAFMRDHPGKLGPSGLLDALNKSIATIKALDAQYHFSGKV